MKTETSIKTIKVRFNAQIKQTGPSEISIELLVTNNGPMLSNEFIEEMEMLLGRRDATKLFDELVSKAYLTQVQSLMLIQ